MLLKSKGHRVTSQREVILAALCQVCTHPTATQVHKIAIRKMPNLSLATVYRTLDFLEKQQLILKLKSKDKRSRYDGNAQEHCHLICKKCGQIIDIFDVKTVRIRSRQLEESGFEIHTDFLEMHGFCQKCLA